MDTQSVFIIAGVIILVWWILGKTLKRILSRSLRIRFVPKRRPIFLSWRAKVRANRTFNKRLNLIEQRYRRIPTKNEKFRTAINASHIVERKRGRRGHWRRQNIRKYLLEKHRVVNKYVIR